MGNAKATEIPLGYGFVRMPGADGISEDNELVATMLEVKAPDDDFAGMWIAQAAAKFLDDKNPVRAFEVIIRSVECGVYPPPQVLEWLADVLRRYHADQGTKPLDRYFGAGNGQTPPYKKLLLEDRDRMLLEDMDRLIYLGATRRDAAEMVHARLINTDWNKSMHDMPDISVDTLCDRHKRGKRQAAIDIYSEFTGDQNKKFIQAFPFLAPSLGGAK
jgi:hypothetical protein